MPPVSVNDHCHVILASVIPDRRDLLDKALRHLGPAHFPDTVLRNLFIMLERYADVTGAVMTRSSLSDLMRNQDEGTILLYCERYDALASTLVDDSDFRWSAQQIRELTASAATAKAIQESATILQLGQEDTQRRMWKGDKDARAYLHEQFADIERELQLQDAPEGDIRTEQQQIMDDYAERQKARISGRGQGVLFGIPDLDDRIGGQQPGELIRLAGSASVGKTTLATQTAWSAVVEQGLNAVFFTTETLRAQVRRKILSRHSRLPQFGLSEGINTNDLKRGTLDDAMVARYAEVVDDFTRNPNYGRLYLAQLPGDSTVGVLESKLHRVSRIFHVDLCVMDYLALLKSDQQRQQGNQELSDVVKSAKVLAATFNDGEGVPLVSPWQISRAAVTKAQETGYYTMQALADTSEAEKSSDVVISLLSSVDDENRYATLKAQILKNRDGQRASAIELSVDYATCQLTGKRASGGMAGILEV